jgi:hypothetical protein
MQDIFNFVEKEKPHSVKQTKTIANTLQIKSVPNFMSIGEGL